MQGYETKSREKPVTYVAPEVRQEDEEAQEGFGNSWLAGLFARTGALGEPVEPEAVVESRRAELEHADQQIASVEALLSGLDAAMPGLEGAELDEARTERELYLQDLGGLQVRRGQAVTELAQAEGAVSRPEPEPEKPEYRGETKVRKDGTIDVALPEEEEEEDRWGWREDEHPAVRAGKRDQELKQAKIEEAGKLAPAAEVNEADVATAEAHDQKVLEAANVAHKALQTNFGKGDAKALLSALHGIDGDRDKDTFYTAYRDANPELEGKDRAEVEAHLQARLLVNLHPADWAEATAHLSGNVLTATKVGLKNAIGDKAYLDEAERDHGREMVSLRKKMKTGARVYSFVTEVTTGQVQNTIDRTKRDVDDNEERTHELMANLSTAQRASLLVDDEFQDIRGDVDDALKGTLGADEDSTVVQKWNAYSHDQKLIDDARFVRDCTRHATEQQVERDGITQDGELHVAARMRKLRNDDAAWSRKIEERYALTLKGKITYARLADATVVSASTLDAAVVKKLPSCDAVAQK